MPDGKKSEPVKLHNIQWKYIIIALIMAVLLILLTKHPNWIESISSRYIGAMGIDK